MKKLPGENTVVLIVGDENLLLKKLSARFQTVPGGTNIIAVKKYLQAAGSVAIGFPPVVG